MTATLSTTAPLPSGARIPLLGFGTWQLTGSAATGSVAAALAAGYRHLDTATMYENEREVGAWLARGLSNAEIARELVVTGGTVKSHVASVLAKLAVRDRVQAAVVAYESRLVTT